MSPLSVSSGGDAFRPFRSSSPTRCVVISGEPARLADWAADLESQGLEVIRCVGPSVNCALVAGQTRCPLLDGTSVAVYDRDALTDELFVRLVRAYPRLAVALAHDEVDRAGRHHPVVERAAPLVGDVCFGEFRRDRRRPV